MSPHLAAALAAAGERLPPERVDQVWLFPARQTGEKETGLAVLAAFPEDGGPAERRVVWTLRYEAEQLKGGKSRRTDVLLEQAVAPAGRVERVIEGVLRRLGSEAETPELRSIGGDPARWAELLAEGELFLDSPHRE